MKGLKIKLTPYPGTLTVLFDREAFEDELGDELAGNVQAATAWEAGDPDILMYLPADSAPGTVCHECIHAALRCLMYVGIDPTDSRGEALCYLADHLVSRIIRHLSKQTKD